MLVLNLEQVTNTMGKQENDGYQHFLFLLNVFERLSFSESLKVRSLCGKALNLCPKFLLI